MKVLREYLGGEGWPEADVAVPLQPVYSRDRAGRWPSPIIEIPRTDCLCSWRGQGAAARVVARPGEGVLWPGLAPTISLQPATIFDNFCSSNVLLHGHNRSGTWMTT